VTSALLAVLTVGFVGGLSSDVNAVTEVRLSNRGLIVGTWEQRRDDRSTMTLEFRRNGRLKLNLQKSDGDVMTVRGSYRVDGRRMKVDFDKVYRPSTAEIVRLDDRVLIYHWQDSSTSVKFRRR
jgi:uncharacterized protein (TIGR03066 family)